MSKGSRLAVCLTLLAAVGILPALADEPSFIPGVSVDSLCMIIGVLVLLTFLACLKGPPESQLTRIITMVLAFVGGVAGICFVRGDFGNLNLSDSTAAPQKVVMTGEGFSIDVPGQLVPGHLKVEQIRTGTGGFFESDETKQIKKQLASLTRFYQLKEKSGEYGVSVSDIPPNLVIRMDLTKAATESMVKGMNANQTVNLPVKKGQYDGTHIEGDLPWPLNNAFVARVFFAPDRRRLYQVVVIGQKDWVKAPARVRFVESFDIVPLQAPGKPAAKPATTTGKKKRKH